ncbi:hypothetical protein [Crossiella sp. CA198]|uniref:hypothetical protein n=1 Tax=Crossiella sp. CA198 TaxID=3455607 RepID=UPI003F8D5E07
MSYNERKTHRTPSRIVLMGVRTVMLSSFYLEGTTMRRRNPVLALTAGMTVVLGVLTAPVASAQDFVCTVNGVGTNGVSEAGRATITGTDGADIIKCHITEDQDGTEPITVNAGAGDDDVEFGGVDLVDAKIDVVNLGPGNDKFSTHNITRTANEGDVFGDDGDDTLLIGGDPRFLDRELSGNSGEVHGGSGNDTIIVTGGWAGADTTGVVPAGNTGRGIVTGGDGDDIITLTAGHSGTAACGDNANNGVVHGGDGADTITLTGGDALEIGCEDLAGGAANGLDYPDMEHSGRVYGGRGVDKITLTGGRNSDKSKQGDSNYKESVVDGGGDGAICTFSPAPVGPVSNCNPA